MTERLFTVDEANALLPVIAPVLERLRAAHAIIADRREELGEHAPGNGGGTEGADYLNALTVAGRSIGELQESGVVVRDPASGLIDFPSEVEGAPAFLCWRLGEERISWWHPTTSGFADRRALE